MRVLTMERPTMAEAEGAIASLWCMLEKYRVPTPKLRVSRVGGAVRVEVEFRSDLEAQLMRRVTAGLALAQVEPARD
jgi:hypothetical protein